MIIMNKKIIGVLFLFISLVSLLSLHFLPFNKKVDNKLPEVKLKEIVNKDKSFAIMIQEKSETDKYQEYSSNTWPGDDYVFKEAKCIDNNGDEITEAVTYEEGKITLTTNKTVYCTVYFDKSIIGKLREKDPNKVLSTEEVGGMYRYQGVGTEEGVDATHKLVDNNYICFGTNDINKCNCNTEENCDKYMYRIIGVTKDNQLYLIKMKGVEEGENNTFQWWENKTDDIEWSESLVYKKLNGEYENSNIFLNNSHYEYMLANNNWNKLIIKYNWLYGDIYNTSNTNLNNEILYGPFNNGLILYQIEQGQLPTLHNYEVDGKWNLVKFQWNKEKKVEAKIGLMYLHDYYLSYDNNVIWRSNYDTKNWLFVDNNKNTTDIHYESLISRIGPGPDGVKHIWGIWTEGITNGRYLDSMNIIRPTFYLTNTIQLSGKGTIDNPYLINV